MKKYGWILFLLFSVAGFGQEAAKSDLALTDSEKKDVALLRARQENINLQFRLLAEKFNQTPEVKKLSTASEALNSEAEKLMQSLAKAHGVDLKTHRLKADGTGFEPIPVKEEKK